MPIQADWGFDVMIQTYHDHRLLFLQDAKPMPSEMASVPVIDGWHWEISAMGQGYLVDPMQNHHCQFDLLTTSVQFEPNGEPFTAPGLSLALIQKMGEKYAYEIVFSMDEKNAYNEHVSIRNNTKKVHDRGVYQQLKGLIQLEQKDGVWMSHVNADQVYALTGLESHHILNGKDGIGLFNRMCETLDAKPLRDPTGYMALKGNIYDFIRNEYQNQYEDILQAIDNQMVDSTGYGVAHILDTLPSTIRHDIREYLPNTVNFGDLRFVEATDERKQIVREFVSCRVSKTLTYEKKRSYEQSSIDKTNAKFVNAGNRFKASLVPSVNEAAMTIT